MASSGGFHTFRGEQVDIGGRRLRVVRAGVPTDAPMIVLECWRLRLRRRLGGGSGTPRRPGPGRVSAYDRAGLGYSDPGPTPRDGRAIAEDLEALLQTLESRAPVDGRPFHGRDLLRAFVGRNTERVCGLVLVDAVTSEAVEHPVAARAIAPDSRAPLALWADGRAWASCGPSPG